MKIYQVIIQDEYNNLYHIGFYYKLGDSIKDINDWLCSYKVKIKKKDLKEYPSTCSMCFDLSLGDLYEDNEDVYGVMIRGFSFDSNDLKV